MLEKFSACIPAKSSNLHILRLFVATWAFPVKRTRVNAPYRRICHYSQPSFFLLRPECHVTGLIVGRRWSKTTNRTVLLGLGQQDPQRYRPSLRNIRLQAVKQIKAPGQCRTFETHTSGENNSLSSICQCCFILLPFSCLSECRMASLIFNLVQNTRQKSNKIFFFIRRLIAKISSVSLGSKVLDMQ